MTVLLPLFQIIKPETNWEDPIVRRGQKSAAPACTWSYEEKMAGKREGPDFLKTVASRMPVYLNGLLFSGKKVSQMPKLMNHTGYSYNVLVVVRTPLHRSRAQKLAAYLPAVVFYERISGHK